MLKVNEEKLLRDYDELVGKRTASLGEIEEQARNYAVSRGYDEEKTAKFVAYTCELEGDGLSTEERFKLTLLESYIEDIEELEEKPLPEEEPQDEASAIEPIYGLINNI